MKTFIISLAVFTAVLILGLVLSVHTENFVGELNEIIESVNISDGMFENNGDEILRKTELIERKWRDGAEKVSAVIGYDGFNRGDDAIGELKAAYSLQDVTGYAEALYKLSDALVRIRNTDGINIHSIF